MRELTFLLKLVLARACGDGRGGFKETELPQTSIEERPPDERIETTQEEKASEEAKEDVKEASWKENEWGPVTKLWPLMVPLWFLGTFSIELVQVGIAPWLYCLAKCGVRRVHRQLKLTKLILLCLSVVISSIALFWPGRKKGRGEDEFGPQGLAAIIFFHCLTIFAVIFHNHSDPVSSPDTNSVKIGRDISELPEWVLFIEMAVGLALGIIDADSRVPQVIFGSILAGLAPLLDLAFPSVETGDNYNKTYNKGRPIFFYLFVGQNPILHAIYVLAVFGSVYASGRTIGGGPMKAYARFSLGQAFGDGMCKALITAVDRFGIKKGVDGDLAEDAKNGRSFEFSRGEEKGNRMYTKPVIEGCFSDKETAVSQLTGRLLKSHRYGIYIPTDFKDVLYCLSPCEKTDLVLMKKSLEASASDGDTITKNWADGSSASCRTPY